MIKLLLCIFSAFLVAVLVLQLRAQKRELQHQVSALHDAIEHQQGRLWNQQLEIASYTAPNAIEHTISNHELNLVAPTTRPAVQQGWIDTASRAAAE